MGLLAQYATIWSKTQVLPRNSRRHARPTLKSDCCVVLLLTKSVWQGNPPLPLETEHHALVRASNALCNITLDAGSGSH
jgi:hypothetical protein